MIFTESVEFAKSCHSLIMPYLDIINACAYNVYQALYREPGDEAMCCSNPIADLTKLGDNISAQQML